MENNQEKEVENYIKDADYLENNDENNDEKNEENNEENNDENNAENNKEYPSSEDEELADSGI